MNSTNWPMIVAAVLILLIGVLFFVLKRGKPHKPDYRVLFILGVTWVPLGIATGNQVFTITGLVLAAVGLANRGRWEERKKWSELDQKTKNLKIVLLALLTLLLVAGVAVYFFRA